MRFHTTPTLFVAALIAVPTGSARAGGVTIRTVALTGDTAPGTGGETFFQFVKPPTVNGSGHTVFYGQGSDFARGLWTDRSGTLELIVRAGDQAPGADPGVTFGEFFTSANAFSRPHLNEAGETAFHAWIAGPGVTSLNNWGIWSEGAGGLDIVARGEDAAPGAGAGVLFLNSFLQSRAPRFSDSGETAFLIMLAGTGITLSNNEAIWVGPSGGLAPLVREGEPAPDTAVGVTFSGTLGKPSLSGSGSVAFTSPITGPGVTPSNGSAIWSGGVGTLSLMVRAGDIAPGTAVGFGSFHDPVINDAGQTAFRATLADGRAGAWSEGSGSLALVALQGDAAPGTPAGVTFQVIASNPVLGGGGHALVAALVTGAGVSSSNDVGIWSTAAGPLGLVAREGDQAPGTDPGVVFQSLGERMINGSGRTAFAASLTGPGVSGSNNRGIWAETAPGVLSLIARTGNLLEVAPSDSRTMSGSPLDILDGSGGQDGRPSGFSDSGHLGFRAFFTDGSSGVFVAETGGELPGDVDGSGTVDVTDLLDVLAAWGACPMPCPPTCDADVDGNCMVNVTDLLAVLANWGE